MKMTKQQGKGETLGRRKLGTGNSEDGCLVQEQGTWHTDTWYRNPGQDKARQDRTTDWLDEHRLQQ